MLNISGIHIKYFPFEDLKLIYDLISFEGEPFLRHYQDNKKKNIISYLVDDEKNKTRWLYFVVTYEDLVSYLSKTISLKEMLLNLKTDFKFFVDFEKEEISDVILSQDELEEKYLPESDSYFPLEIPSVYSPEIQKHNIVNTFVERGVFMKAEPIEKARNSGLVSALDASTLLYAVGTSWENKVEQEVEDALIKKGITDAARIRKAQKEVTNLYSMNVARLKVASFAVGLYPNPMINISENNVLDREWLLSVLSEFKNDVVDIDKKSNEEVAAITGKYRDVTKMKSIYEPIIKLYENTNVTVSLTDNHFNNLRVLKPVSDEIKARILIDKPKKVPSEDETSERVIKTKFNDKTNKPILTGFTLFDLDTSTSWETDKLQYENRKFNLAFPLTLKYSKVGNVTILEHQLLDIHASGEEMSEVINDVARKFNEVYELLFGYMDEKDLTNDALRKKKFVELIISSIDE